MGSSARESNHETKKDEDFDPIKKSIGSLGRWQICIILFIFLVKFPVAWHQLGIVFLAPPVEFYCAEPGNETEKCSTNCTKHEFDRSIFKETIITEWDLVCQRAQLANLAQTIVMLGILVGSIIFGYLSDKFGRKTPLAGAILLQIITGVGAAFMPRFWLFLVFKFLSAVATGGTMVTSFVLVMELVGAEWRAFMGVVYQIPFNVGHITLSGFGYFIRDWQYFQLAISLPSIFLLSYYFILPESPRWLLAVRKPNQAIAVLERGAKSNKLPTAEIGDNVAKAMKMKDSNKGDTKAGNVMDLVRTKNMRLKSICICYNWVVCGLCFFGVAQYLGQTGGNIFINVAVSAVVQVPGTLVTIILLKVWGRKRTQIVSNIGSGVSCLLIPLVPPDPAWIRVTLAVIGMFFLAAAFSSVYIWSGELFPTVIRNVGIGLASMFARVGSMISPFVAGLSTVQTFLPPLIFGVIPMIGAATCFLLPETLGCPLPETIEDGENFGKARSNLKGIDNMGVDATEMEVKQ